MTLAEQYAAAQAQLADVTKERDALRVSYEDAKAALAKAHADLADVQGKAKDAVAAALQLAEEAEGKAKDARAEAEGLRGKLALVPDGDAVLGGEPVAASAQAAPVADHDAELAKLSGPERVAYYRKHRAEIDALAARARGVQE